MTEQNHLQVFSLTLQTRSPVFIGNGHSVTKKEYLFNSRSNLVSFPDEEKLFYFLVSRNLVDAYEAFMVRDTDRDLFSFLKRNAVAPSEIEAFTRYKVDAANALDDDHTLKEIQRFIRNAAGQVYVPGSSIKGALRTALLKAMLLERPPRNPSRDAVYDKKQNIEAAYFHTLSLKPDQNNPLNSILQGIRISDSLPIPDRALCVTRKFDDFPDGTYNSINVCRECIRPGTTIHSTITLDQSILLGKLTADTIRQAIAAASRYYQETVLPHYLRAENDMNSATILLGGGVGFQSKTVTDPYFGKDALSVASDILKRSFPKHHHEGDADEKISPRALKQTSFQNATYPYGVCEVTIR